jgi:hypothetical protein
MRFIFRVYAANTALFPALSARYRAFMYFIWHSMDLLSLSTLGFWCSFFCFRSSSSFFCNLSWSQFFCCQMFWFLVSVFVLSVVVFVLLRSSVNGFRLYSTVISPGLRFLVLLSVLSIFVSILLECPRHIILLSVLISIFLLSSLISVSLFFIGPWFCSLLVSSFIIGPCHCSTVIWWRVCLLVISSSVIDPCLCSLVICSSVTGPCLSAFVVRCSDFSSLLFCYRS